MRRPLAVLAVCLSAAASACATKAPPPRASHAADEPHWQDVFETTPELLVIVRPQALRHDKIYGPLLRRAIEAARQQSRVVAATRALDTMEDAEEVVIGMRPPSPGHDTELILVERGVRADVDPEKLVDADGRALWVQGPSGSVRELERRKGEGADDASLFELPGRTWVIATGEARTRAREAFAHPVGRPPVKVDDDALAIVRIDGPSLVARVAPLQDRGGLAAVGHALRSVVLVLPPGGERSVKAALTYAQEDAAALAEVTAREAIGAVARSKRIGLDWLTSATVERPGQRVVITAPLPAQLIDGLLHASSPAPEAPRPDAPAPAPGPQTTNAGH